MDLSSEDSLRLNVLLKQELQALRIDASRMIVHALTAKGEATVTLNPNVRDDLYLKRVRELVSTHVLGSPGGYPVYIKRWTRSGQAREDESLRSLLLLGEPEAVVAVVHNPELSPELARLAWWAMPEAENARRLLEKPQVAASEVGPELAQFLIEYLPFETEPHALQETVRLVLQPGLASAAVRADLWKRAGRKGAYFIGFLQACPDDLPETLPPHPAAEAVSAALGELLAADNPYARLLCKSLEPQGQAWLKTAEQALDKIANQDTTVALFNTIGVYFGAARPPGVRCADSAAAVAQAEACVAAPEALAPGLGEVLAAVPDQRERLVAILTLALIDENLLDTFFAYSDAVGPLMRRKLAPWTQPLLAQIARLRG